MIYIVLFAIVSLSHAQNFPPLYSSYDMCPSSRSMQPPRACLRTNAAPVPLSTFNVRQPMYTRVIRDSPDFRNIDNICTTMFQAPDDCDTYIIYDSIVYCDGSYKITTSIATEIGVGTISKANAYSTITQRVLAFDGADTYMFCRTNIFGDDPIYDVFVSSAACLDPLSPQSLNNIRNILSNNGQDPCGLYVLPYNRPTRCITQQVCSLNNPFLFR